MAAGSNAGGRFIFRASNSLGRGRNLLRVGRNFSDGLQDLGSDGVGVALRVRAAIFQIALVIVLYERVRHADRSAAVGDAVAERVPWRGLVLAGQALVVVRAVDLDVVHQILVEGRHQGFEVRLAADRAQMLRR